MKKVIDADGHANEPDDLFDRYLEKDFKEARAGSRVRSAKFNTGWSKVSCFRVRWEIVVMELRTAICSQKANPTWRSTRPGLDDVEGRLKDLDQGRHRYSGRLSQHHGDGVASR